MTAELIDGIPYDVTWQDPSEEQMACLEWVRARRPSRVDEVEAVEMIMFAEKSRWYRQVMSWKRELPEELHPFQARRTNIQEVFDRAIQGVAEIVDLGYNAEKKRWWDIEQMRQEDLQIYLLFIGMVTKDLIRLELMRPSRQMHSFGLQFFMEMMMGRQWGEQIDQALKNMERQSRNITRKKK
jgi:hypothetical protein